MSLTQQQILLVQDSWEKVVPISATAAELFYGQLFEIAPEVKPLFKGDMKIQGNKLMSMLNTAVRSLNNLETIVPVIEESGRRHAGYGVKDEHYQKVAEALLWTLGKGLGDAFTEEVKHAWIAVYVLVSTVMKNAAMEAAR
ncbi:MAG: globin family protein [Methylobacter sp.]